MAVVVSWRIRRGRGPPAFRGVPGQGRACAVADVATPGCDGDNEARKIAVSKFPLEPTFYLQKRLERKLCHSQAQPTITLSPVSASMISSSCPSEKTTLPGIHH